MLGMIVLPVLVPGFGGIFGLEIGEALVPKELGEFEGGGVLEVKTGGG